MLLVIHILTATFGIIASIVNVFMPSKKIINITYFLTFGAIFSGVILTIIKPVLLHKTCILGLIYLIFVFASIKVIKLRENVG